MSKISSPAAAAGKKPASMTTRTLTYCALLAALSFVLARLMGFMPTQVSRFSIEAIPVFLAGTFFGPLAGALVGFTADLVGALFSGYGYNPLLCVPPILYGVCGGLFRFFLNKRVSIPRLLLAYAPAVVLGSILWQSFALSFVYGKGFWLLLSTRTIQFAITMVLEVLVTFFLFRSRMFHRMGIWPLGTLQK